ncbi:MAG: aldehyde dehydrogenase (NADP(+)) [Planctomycetes bacterium]|nr:aldehyde dehydrogenase (NADP(+)) [Planctomycetota bacterium]
MAIEARTQAPLPPTYRDATAAQVDTAATAASAVAAEFAATPAAVRASLLRALADGLGAAGDELLERVEAETALPPARVLAERGRTQDQLRQFAALLDDGSWVAAHLDRARPERQPQPKPDLRRMLVALGPVAVFGASNFPLAYSVAGGDTASALAAGCPVVVKGHPAHPGTSELVGRVIGAAVAATGLPPGVFALLHGRSHDVGAQLVRHPAITAVGFTGSHRGGRALFDLAAARPRPIPVFAEMGSMNPVFVLPVALARRGAAIAEQIAASATLAMGQFCTSPGLLLWVDGDGCAALQQRLREKIAATAPGVLVHPGIREGFEAALADVQRQPVEVLARAASAASPSVCPTLLGTSITDLLGTPRLRTEIYGPALLTAGAASADELLAVATALDGHLTATIHAEADDLPLARQLVAILQHKVGRIVWNGVPTGVEVCPSMVHGGPYPASTDARFSAVGTTAIARWTRPVCFQDLPAALLPPELQDGNPRGLWRTVDGAPGRH